jgi:hypothetical protein
MPSSAEELFQPWFQQGGKVGKDLPEWAQGYLSLLAESTNSQGSMQKHLVKLLARGANGANKACQMVSNPIDGLTEALADTGSELLLKQLAKAGSGGLDSKVGQEGWKKLRLSVLATGCIKANARAKDDSCIPEPSVNPVHSKMLSIMLSMMMSGATSGVAQAMPIPDMPFLHHADGAIEVSHTVSVESKAAKFASSMSSQRTPSICVRHASGGAEGLLGAGGMAASTAMRMLRSGAFSLCHTAECHVQHWTQAMHACMQFHTTTDACMHASCMHGVATLRATHTAPVAFCDDTCLMLWAKSVLTL